MPAATTSPSARAQAAPAMPLTSPAAQTPGNPVLPSADGNARARRCSDPAPSALRAAAADQPGPGSRSRYTACLLRRSWHWSLPRRRLERRGRRRIRSPESPAAPSGSGREHARAACGSGQTQRGGPERTVPNARRSNRYGRPASTTASTLAPRSTSEQATGSRNGPDPATSTREPTATPSEARCCA